MDARFALFQAQLTSGSSHRDAALLRRVVGQFDVVRNPHFQPQPGATWCNFFVSVCTRALGCEIPHFVPVRFDVPSGHWIFREQTANAMAIWLHEGAELGWRQVELEQAKDLADGGYPVVASYRNPVAGQSGHVAIALPSGPGEPLHIAQAGAECLFDEPIARGFGTCIYGTQYFSHE